MTETQNGSPAKGNAAMDVGKFVCADLAGLTYKSAPTVENIAKQFNLPIDKIIKLNANENVYGLDDDELVAAPAKGAYNLYPDSTQLKLRRKIADVYGVPMECIVCGAGSDDILDMIMRMMRPSKLLTATPTFGMYSFLAKVSGIEYLTIPRNEDFTVDIDLLIETIRAEQVPLVILTSPNNPTGTPIPNEDIARVLKEDCVVVVDEAYTEFTDSSAVDLFGEAHPNLIVTRTFSKWAGLAGLRVGFSFANKAFTDTMLAIKQPYNISTSAESAALTALEKRSAIMEWVKKLRQEKDRLYEILQDSKRFPNLHPVPSEANFVLMKVTGPVSAEEIYNELMKRGILIRYFGKQGGDLTNYIRISAGKPEQIDAVLAALDEIFAQAEQ